MSLIFPPDNSTNSPRRRNETSRVFESLLGLNKEAADPPSLEMEDHSVTGKHRAFFEYFNSFRGAGITDLPSTVNSGGENSTTRKLTGRGKGLIVLFVIMLVALSIVVVVGADMGYINIPRPTLSQSDIDNTCSQDVGSISLQEASAVILPFRGYVYYWDNINHNPPIPDPSSPDPVYKKVLSIKVYTGSAIMLLSPCDIWVRALIQTSKGKIYRQFMLELVINGYDKNGSAYLTSYNWYRVNEVYIVGSL